MINWAQLRKDHIAPYDGIYLNSGANGLISQKTLDYELEETQLFLANPGTYRMDFMVRKTTLIKQEIGKLVQCSPEQIALVQNFSIAINFFAASLSKDSKVAYVNGDYPSLTMPFHENGLEMLPFSFDQNHEINLIDFEQFLRREKPSIFLVSHCQWLTGYLADLESIGNICSFLDIIFVVDATQSFGAMRLDAKKCKIDVLGASCYKWARAGFGNGFIYISASTLEKFKPKSAGFNSTSWQNGIPSYSPSIKSYEPGHHDHNAFNRLYAALTNINSLGIDYIQERINSLMDYFLEQINTTSLKLAGDFENENRLGIVSVKSKPNLFKHIIHNNIEVSERGDNIRIGIHLYNNEADIDALITCIQDFEQ